ncbi:MAG: hypothetical protein ACRDHW_00285 [Ktedonobacteraceae bacterium]
MQERGREQDAQECLVVHVIIEPLTTQEEHDFLDCINASVARCEMSREEAQVWIAREYELMYP